MTNFRAVAGQGKRAYLPVMKRYFLGLLPLGLGLVLAMANGPQHAMWPRLAGLKQVAPGIWADRGDAKAHLPLVAEAQLALAPFFGEAPQPDRMILCTASPCADRFGVYSAGLTYGERLVILAPRGLTAPVVTHELAHVATNRGLTFSALWNPPFPIWFHEGLAIWLAPRDWNYARPDSAADAEWITEAQTLRDWKALVTEDSYPHVYGSAGRMVEALAEEIGPEALRQLVLDVQGGADFEERLAAARR